MTDNNHIDTSTQYPARRLGGDPERSVGDFLIEIDSVLRPLEDLSSLLQKHVKEEGGAPGVTYNASRTMCQVQYRDEAIAKQGKQRLSLLLDDGKDITVSLAMSQGDHLMEDGQEESHWRLSVPVSLVQPIHDHLENLLKQRADAAEKISDGNRPAANKAKKKLENALIDLGLIVRVPDAAIQRLLYAYDRLPMHGATNVHPSRADLLPLIEHFMELNGEGGIRMDASNTYGREFTEALLAIAETINTQRKNPSHVTMREERHQVIYSIDHLPFGFYGRLEKLLGERWDALRMQTTSAEGIAPFNQRGLDMPASRMKMPVLGEVRLAPPHIAPFYTGGDAMPTPEKQPDNVVSDLTPKGLAASLQAPDLSKGRKP